MAVPSTIVIATAFIYLGFDSKQIIWAVLALITLIVFFVVMSNIKYYYISFYAGPDKIRLRYKSLSPFPTQNKSIQIAANKFHDYKLETKLFGKQKSIIFYLETPGGVAAYPKTSLSALNNEQIKQLCKALDLIKEINKTTKQSDTQ